MDKLKEVIDQYGRWKNLSDYIDRIEAYHQTDFSLALENAKSLLETICKEICKIKGEELDRNRSINAALKKAFSVIGYPGSDMVVRISSALATIGQQMGELRNNIGPTSHGRTLQELEDRNNKINDITRELLIDTTVIIACLLIRTFENENPWVVPQEAEERISLGEGEGFNNYWDGIYGEFSMGSYSYSASEILYYVDQQAYIIESKAFEEGEE